MAAAVRVLDSLARLDATFRQRQLGLQVGAGLIISRTFAQISPEDIVAETSPDVEEWLDRSSLLTLAMRRRASAEARAFYDDVHDVMSPGTPRHDHEEPDLPDMEQLRTSLFVTGVVRARAKIKDLPQRPQAFTSGDLESFFERQRGDTPGRSLIERQLSVIDSAYPAQLEEVMSSSGDHAGAAGARHVGNGAREQIQDSAKADRRAIGWIRVTSGEPCYFCAMLASRGPVYSVDSFDDSDALFDGAGHHKVHDNCGCSMRQVYTRKADEYPQLNVDLELGWRDLTDKLGHSPSLEEWRNNYEGSTARR